MSSTKTAHPDFTRQLLRQLRQEFLADLPERYAQMEYVILKLGQTREPLEAFAELYRRVHSLKGSAGTHGVHIVSRICHQFEDHLQTVQNNVSHINQTFIDDCLRYLDLIDRAYHVTHVEDENMDTGLADIEQALLQFQQQDTSRKLAGLISVGSNLMTMICRDALAGFPIRLHYADNGIDALSRLVHERYDFALLSRHIAPLNGTAITYAIRASGAINEHIKIIMITTDNDFQFAPSLAPDFIIQKDQALHKTLATTVRDILKHNADTSG